MNIKTVAIAFFAAVVLNGCATSNPESIAEQLPDGFRVSLVTARDAGMGRGPLGVGDRFSLDGKVVAFASFTWTNLDEAWGKRKLEFYWYNGERLIRKGEVEPYFGRSPYHVWGSVLPTALGPGDCRVEVRLHGKMLAERRFKVVDATSPVLPFPPGATSFEFDVARSQGAA
jgi:hypothetical protein